MARSASLRRRQAGVLLVGATEPEVGSWLHAAGHATRRCHGADAALAALGEEPADLVIADREPGGLDAPAVCLRCARTRGSASAWLLAITSARRAAGAAPTSAPTTTCTGRSRARSCSPARAPACAPSSSAPTTRCCAR